jgi:DNA-binding Xre family transcriptional regulator
MTKLEQILMDKGYTQSDLQKLIYAKSGFVMSKSHISRIANGHLTDIKLSTITLMAEALDVKVDDLSELKNIRKQNIV